MNVTTQERVRKIVEARNQRDPAGVYDAENFRCCPVCGRRCEIRLQEDDPNINGVLRDLFVKCNLPIWHKCNYKN